MDETYQIYVNRVAPLTLPATYQTQLQNIQHSPKFKNGQPVTFPGYSVMSPPGVEDLGNGEFYRHLEEVQQQLLQKLAPGMLIPVPGNSFHVTLADLIWDRSYQEAIQENPHFEQQLKDCIRESFQKYEKSEVNRGLSQWQLLGLLVFPRALGVALVPNNGAAYEQIVQLRRAIYQNSGLMGLGIEQQYYFTAHITLGYFGEIPASLNREALTGILTEFNDQLLETDPQILAIEQVQLRKFKDMTGFKREAEDPILVL